MRLSPIGLVFIIFLWGCSAKESQEPADTADQIKESLTIEDTNATATDAGSACVIQFVREHNFGSTDDMLIGKIATVAIDVNDRVFIADRDQTTIHVFNPDGKYLTSIGQQGKGPGEFGAVSPNTTMTIDSNQLYITDAFRFFPHRAHVYLLEDLSFSHTMKLLAVNKDDVDELEKHYPNQIYPLDNGQFLVDYRRIPNEYKDANSFIHYVIQDSTGTIISDPILEQKDLTYLVFDVMDAPRPYLAVSTFPFYGKSLLVISEDNYLYAANNTEEFKIDVYDIGGEHIRTFQHPFSNRPLIRSRLIDRYKRLGEEVAANMISEAQNLSDSWPALETMFFDDENRLWVSTIVEDNEVREWWILQDDGEVITKFTWPKDKPIELVKNGSMYVRETEEETGLEEILRYRIVMD